MDSGTLLDESAPGFTAAVAQHDSETVGYAGNSAAVSVSKGVAHGLLGYFFRSTTPDIAEFITQAKMIAVTEAIEARAGGFFFKIEEATGHFAVYAAALENTTMNH